MLSNGWKIGATLGAALFLGACTGDTATTTTTESESGTSTGSEPVTTSDGSTSDAPTTDGPPGVCGDGKIDAGETCDNGTENGPTGACTAECVANVCGDGMVGPAESCDDGNDDDADECSNACKLASCGDGEVGPGEACDDGNADNTDSCSDTCTLAVCGDELVQSGAGEACDAGADNNDNGACTSTCQEATCGDGNLWNSEGGTETCDDGKDNGPGNACKDDCTDNVCGDAAVGPGEACDDGNVDPGDGCSATCELEACGNNKPDPGEVCDDGKNGDNDDGCTDICAKPKCGDGFEQASLMEQCDLGGDNSNTGACLVTCKDATCGDGQVHEGAEECDDGNNNGDTKACKADCSKNVCGDMKVGPGEECDDGNDNDADACKNDCKLTTQVSCKAIKSGNPAAKDGVYTLDVDGPGPKASFKVYCDMTTDGGGWQIMNYLRKPQHWDIPIFQDSGVVGDTLGGFSSGQTLQTANDTFKERIIIYLKLIEFGQSLGKQWMVSDRPDAILFSAINSTPGGWGYRDSYGYADPTVSNVCTHGCTTYRGFGMFHDYENTFGWCGTQTGDYGCRDGNNICWMPRSLGCNVGAERCAYLVEDGEGVLYGVR